MQTDSIARNGNSIFIRDSGSLAAQRCIAGNRDVRIHAESCRLCSSQADFFLNGPDSVDITTVGAKILDRLDLTGLADLSVSSLPTGHARLVELGRALAARPSVLLLDEPASGLDDSETDDFGDLLISLAGNGLGILLVEHDVALVMRICQSLAVLDFGNIIAKGAPDEVRSNQAVLAAYLGSTPTSIAGGPSSVADSSGNPLAAGNGVVA